LNQIKITYCYVEGFLIGGSVMQWSQVRATRNTFEKEVTRSQ